MSSLQDLEDEVDHLRSELQEALALMVRVARGEQTVQGMGELVSLNYPKFRERLPEAMRALPPKME